ncbi:DUF3347 domain-containing protein [Chitinophaga sp. XS-30]|uniref:DUF3347 domain-containing protein n=1 Tax=Chitinophaga sp. XS-30 TaxID=2604421 RepID=UPI0011DCDE66|nr:DUF3347 domain-containing protein [Chitinophaga sp. XS-30]QEH42478.1 DUF3347 domain-containing protein [Chitinophaga sp. XS-30]
MKSLIRTTTPLALAVLLSACGNNAGKENTAAHEHADHDHSEMPHTTSAVQLKDDKLNAVYPHYIHLTNALINGDAAEAKIAGNAIAAGTAGMSGADAVRSAANTITSATDIEAQRVAYSTLSNDFIALVKQSGLKSGELYVDFCPMALDNQGAYWLSAGKEIKNPYFGEKMMTCGEVKETLE